MDRILKRHVIIAVAILSFCDAAKILLVPFPFTSHVNSLVYIGDTLIEKGHDVKIMLSASYPELSTFQDKASPIQALEYRIKYDDFYTMPQLENPMTAEHLIGIQPIKGFRSMLDGFAGFCYNALEDEELFKRVKQERFDLAIVDAFPCIRCFFIMLYRLNIPYVSVSATLEPWLYRSPAVPSFVPFPISFPPKSDKMTFVERLHNLVQLVDWSAFPGIPYLHDSLVSKYAAEMPFVTIDWLAGQSMLWFIDTDTALDYARPMMPNEIDIGGLSTKPAKPLTGEALQLANKAQGGLIIASFGSFDILTEDILSKFLQAFSDIPQTVQVFMRYSKQVPSTMFIPTNVKLLKWLPQNDLLGHRKTKLFLTHGGTNGQFEGLYHAVPMIMFPLFGDQPYNAKRGQLKGHAVTMDILQFTPTELASNIKLMLYSNNTFKANIKKDSDIFKSRIMNPRQRAVYWIEHVMEFGGAHLRSYGLDIPWYQYLMLDIAALLILVFMVISLFGYFCISYLCSKFCKSKRKLKAQ